mgnify:CR=1 FL=1
MRTMLSVEAKVEAQLTSLATSVSLHSMWLSAQLTKWSSSRPSTRSGRKQQTKTGLKDLIRRRRHRRNPRRPSSRRYSSDKRGYKDRKAWICRNLPHTHSMVASPQPNPKTAPTVRTSPVNSLSVRNNERTPKNSKRKCSKSLTKRSSMSSRTRP